MKKYIPEIGDKLLYNGEIKTIDTIEDIGDAFTVYGYGFGAGSLWILEEILPMVYDYDTRMKVLKNEIYPECTRALMNANLCHAYNKGFCMNWSQCLPENH